MESDDTPESAVSDQGAPWVFLHKSLKTVPGHRSKPLGGCAEIDSRRVSSNGPGTSGSRWARPLRGDASR